MAEKRHRQTGLIFIGLVISLLLGALAFRQVEAKDLWEGIKNVNPLAFGLYFLIRIFNFILPGLRSKVMFSPISNVSFLTLMKSVWLAFAVNNIIPLRAGEIARVAYLAQKAEVPTATVLTIVAFERILDMVGLLLLVSFVAIFWGGTLPVGPSAIVAALLLCGVVLGLWWVAKFPNAFLSL